MKSYVVISRIPFIVLHDCIIYFMHQVVYIYKYSIIVKMITLSAIRKDIYKSLHIHVCSRAMNDLLQIILVMIVRFMKDAVDLH